MYFYYDIEHRTIRLNHNILYMIQADIHVASSESSSAGGRRWRPTDYGTNYKLQKFLLVRSFMDTFETWFQHPRVLY